MRAKPDMMGALRTLQTASGPVSLYSLQTLGVASGAAVDRLPKTILVLLEAALRHCNGSVITQKDVLSLAAWASSTPGSAEIPFRPARVVLQDFTGVPSIVDLAVLREACARLGGDPESINPLVPCDLVIDHSVQVDHFATPLALQQNLDMEFHRNRERYAFLKWGQQAFSNFRVVPPGTGIVHQVNLEYLSGVVVSEGGVVYPDSLVGTDSHTTMINGLGVVGWGVGGIEAEAVMLGQPLYLLLPRVTGVRLHGSLPMGATATDLVLTLTALLRKLGVVNDFVEFFGSGLDTLTLPDRATIANMAPEYGATMGFFPVDTETLNYLKRTGRGGVCDLVERYSKEQGLWREAASLPLFSRVVDFDLQTVEPSLAGPKKPQELLALSMVSRAWQSNFGSVFGRPPLASDTNGKVMEYEGGSNDLHGEHAESPDRAGSGTAQRVEDGMIVIAAITSCTNTSNPAVMIAAGLVARAARKRGLRVKPWVKTSLAPGSRVVSDYLEASGLSADLDALGFATVGYGCTTCIGNSGPLPDTIASAITESDSVVCSVLSGNRNFEGRIHAQIKANYLASPPLVVAYAIAGRITIDLSSEPLGVDTAGQPVCLRELWPTEEEIQRVIGESVTADMFILRYGDVFSGTRQWHAVEAPVGRLYAWDETSTYIRKPPFLERINLAADPLLPIDGARCLALFGDSVTTDHISPAGSISSTHSAGLYLRSLGVEPEAFNSFGSRRGNHEVMQRGTFANSRIRNRLAPETVGGFTRKFTSGSAAGEVMTMYDAAMGYKTEGVALVVIAGKDYGMGSSRDWAAKGTLLLGVRAVIACSFERIHRSNLVGMGVLPLEFTDGASAASLGLTGQESYTIPVNDRLVPGALLEVEALDLETSRSVRFTVRCRIDTPVEAGYYRHGGILPAVLRTLIAR